MTNETLKTIEERYSCRSFTGEMPSDAQLQAIVNAAVTAPSAVNGQPWRVIVVKNKALIQEMEAEAMRVLSLMEDRAAYDRIMSRGGKLFYNAPCAIVLPIDPENTIRAAMDCGILCQNIALAAASLGLGNLICGLAGLAFAGDKADEFKSCLGFPEGFEIGITVLVGNASAPCAPHKPDYSKISFIE